ncbi:MAG: acyl-CoA dehydrogenase [Pelagibacterales bacterium]|nr:acyl-CoA dehydrogenase [Pelagibacterales bacterium]OUV27427.1 MAG: acyl-CoA dehydrogenase [Alphaproteobacteria bacterium TMED109]RCL83406.1 MAG: acyl-CoA dehydrogenase [Alphaproteobacteria bacterium]
MTESNRISSINSLNGDQWEDIRSGVITLCSNFPGEYWRSLDSKREYPEEFVKALTDAGYLACLIPEEYGGSGLPIQAACIILEEIQRSGGNGAACHAQMYIMGALLRHGSKEQKDKYLPKISSGELRLQAFGVTEPDAGTDTLSIRTKAEKTKTGYIINGQKVWTSRAEYSDLMLLLARTSSNKNIKRTEGLSLFIIDMQKAKNNGLTIKPIRTMINHATTEVFFDDLEIPFESLIGSEGKGFKYILDGMNAERILIAAECVGDAKFFLDKATEYASSREVFGRPIGQNQGIQFPIARAYAEMEASALMVDRAAQLFDNGISCGAEANIAKLLSSEASWKAAESAMQTFGGYGFAEDYDIERKYRETRLYQTAPISTNLILAFIAQNILGLTRSY